MSDDDAFVQAILAAPDDDGLKLVYADWLEERGDPRGEFLRLAVVLGKSTGNPALASVAAARLVEIRAEVDAEWLLAVGPQFAEDDIRAAVFRWLLGDGPPARLTFLAIEGECDPSTYLLAHFAKNRSQIKPKSAIRRGGGQSPGLVDAETGKQGVVYSIEAARWTGARAYEVDVGFFTVGLGGYKRDIAVELRGRDWVVIGAGKSWGA